MNIIVKVSTPLLSTEFDYPKPDPATTSEAYDETAKVLDDLAVACRDLAAKYRAAGR